jgi:hypothetical protein
VRADAYSDTTPHAGVGTPMGDERRDAARVCG